MEQIMYEVYVAEATIENDYRNFDSSEKKEAYINQVFKMNGVTQSQWDTSLSWYSDRIDLYLRMNDSVKSRLKREQSILDTEIAQINIQNNDMGEAVYSASYIPKNFSFRSLDIQRDRLRFRIDSTEISENIKDSVFSFDYSVLGVNPSSVYTLTSLITLVYSDTTIYNPKKITENITYSTSIAKYINNDTLKQIFGYIQLENPTGINPNIQLYNISMSNK
ncbi:MAG: DUF4296 domain-containing protein [Fermentimonas sp.]|nr:DUF4296 domain-containing protein [Fermentimonas sp.]